MAREAIDVIFAAEKTAADLVNEAKSEATQSSRRLRDEASNLSEEMWDVAGREIKAILEEARSKAEENAQPILEAAEAKVKAYQDIDQAVIARAADLIVEQVKQYGNS